LLELTLELELELELTSSEQLDSVARNMNETPPITRDVTEKFEVW
jgi:hypothetical protein